MLDHTGTTLYIGSHGAHAATRSSTWGWDRAQSYGMARSGMQGQASAQSRTATGSGVPDCTGTVVQWHPQTDPVLDQATDQPHAQDLTHRLVPYHSSGPQG